MLLDINLVKTSRIEFVQDPAPPLTLPDGASPPKWLEYIYRTAHPALHWLPTKLAEWIRENIRLQEPQELGFQITPIRERSQASAGLNSIMHAHVVAGELITFGCVEWVC